MYGTTTALPGGQVRRQPTQPILTQNEAIAKEKLASYVYEYLVHNGAPKAAEAFKAEILASSPNTKLVPADQGPGFLLNWWYVFWDLYCGAPERRDGSEGAPSIESKAFLDMAYQQHPPGYGPGMMNGMHGPQFGTPAPMAMGPEGMMNPGFAGAPRAGYGPPGGMARGAPPPGYMFTDPRMAPGQRMPPQAMRMQANFAGMRPGAAPPQPMRGYGPPFMESGASGFAPGPMMANGVLCSQAGPMQMASPSLGADGAPTHHDPRYMMMPGSSNIPVLELLSHARTIQYTMGGPGDPSTAAPPTTTTATSEGSSSLANVLNGGNGEELKQSPAGTPHAVNGGTPGAPGSHPTPGSQAPGSVQSQGASAQAQEGPIDTTAPPGTQQEEQNEITKIKQSIMDDVKQFGSVKEEDCTAPGYNF